MDDTHVIGDESSVGCKPQSECRSLPATSEAHASESESGSDCNSANVRDFVSCFRAPRLSDLARK